MVADLPLSHRLRFLHPLVWGIGSGNGPRAAVDKGTGIRRVLEDGQDGRDRRLSPDQVAETVTPGQKQIAVVEELHDPGCRLDLEERGEEQIEPALDFSVGMFEHPSQRVADQPDWQRQGQFAALGLVEQSGRQAGAQGMELQFGDQAFESEDQPAVDRGGVVDAVLVADEARAVST
jgi:hypothetical protein